ncbi:MAG: hypothetical protein HPY58_12820 [Firmicutes bacterium]|nr:hypothetical protein [Bacillota bacterium]
MPFKIKRGIVDNTSWGDVDKTALRNRLVKGLEEGAEGVREAIREVYAVIRSDDITEAPSQNWWGPHHIIRQDGSVVLNRGGLIAAAQALAGARAEPDLTPAQRREAAQHLMRHYREIEDLEPPESLTRAAGEMVRLAATITGEMRPEDIPLAPGVDLAALKAGDDDPLEVVVEIPAGKSRRGWNYLPETIQKIAGEVATKTATGFLGHQDPNKFDYEFPIPVTHWVGALFRDGKAYIRGVVDAAAKDLKRWIRANRVNQVSIFGIPTLRQAGGETQVVDYQLLSIDWTPLDRAGMPTRVVAIGEMDSIVGAGEPRNHGGGNMTLGELLAELRKLGVKPSQIIGEMGWDVKTLAKELGWKLDDVAGEINAERWNQLQEMAKAVGEMVQMFDLGQDAKLADLVNAVKAAREVQQKAALAEHEKLVDKVIGEMVVAEAARPLVKRMLQVKPGATEDEIKKAVGEMLEAEDVKKALAGLFKDPVIAPKAGRQDNNSGLRVKRIAI